MNYNSVFVLDQKRKPLNPCHPAKARKLLKEGKAAVFRRFPFTIILKEVKNNPVVKSIRLKIDPGSKETGMVLVDEKSKNVLFALELKHRGELIKKTIDDRRSLRRNRRNRKTRYRAARFDNRKRVEGWLPPSLMHRVQTTMTWVKKLMRFAPVTALSLERVKFDTQKMQNPEISGIEYQNGELMGYDVKEYLLEKWGRKCVYCGADNVPLEIEHIIPRSKGGTNRISNLAISCRSCNIKKGNLLIEDFLKNDSDKLKKIKKELKIPLKDTAAVNATRNTIFKAMNEIGLPLEIGTGSRTKYNRCSLGFPKAHWIDAACVGISGEIVNLNPNMKPLFVIAKGHGNRQMCRTNKFGFPICHKSRSSNYFGFRTGDIVKAYITKGKNVGIHIGRLLCRAKGSFDINTKIKKISGISYKYCSLIHRKDGYEYN